VSQQINLFNPLFEKQKKYFSAVTLAQSLLIIGVGCALLVVYGNRRVAVLDKAAAASKAQLALKEAQLKKVNLDFVPQQKSKAVAQQLAQAEADFKSLQTVVEVLKGGEFGNTRGFSEYFRAFARQSVDGLWLTGLSILGAGHEIALQGRVLQPELVPRYLGRLGREGVMQGKAFASLEIDAPRAAPSAPSPDKGAASDVAPVPAFLEFRLQSTAPKPGDGASPGKGAGGDQAAEYLESYRQMGQAKSAPVAKKPAAAGLEGGMELLRQLNTSAPAALGALKK
jgi:hypothetical protein